MAVREAPPNARSGLQAPPAFLERPKEEYFQEVGRELLIPCSAQGDPPPAISWAKVRLLAPLCPCAHALHPCLSLPLVILREGGSHRRQGGEDAGAALGEGWPHVSSGLTSGSVGGPAAAGPGPGGQQQ